VIKSKRDKAIFLVAYRHGLRASEIGLLQWADVDVKQGRISSHRLKGSISAVYPMQPDVLKAIRSYLRTRADESPYLFVSNRGVPISRFMLHHLMQTYGEVAGLPVEKRKFHCLKHSIATHLLDAGADLAFVKDWLGHANIQNTTIYARLTTATLDSTARKVFASHRVV
jgi:site-specific recombinase XerD